MRKNQENTTKKLVMTGMFTALLAVLSQISIPMPSGVPITLQTFAVALTACVLGWKMGIAAVALYLCLGAMGLPIFANFGAGLGTLLGASGGFLIGFLPMTFLTGLCNPKKHKISAFALAFVGLLLCHLSGIFQFMILMERNFWEAALLVSIPYLLKDVVSMGMAFAVGRAVKRALKAAGMFYYA